MAVGHYKSRVVLFLAMFQLWILGYVLQCVVVVVVLLLFLVGIMLMLRLTAYWYLTTIPFRLVAIEHK